MTPQPMELSLPPHGRHRQVAPKTLFFGAALTLVSTMDSDGRSRVRPFSACMAVGRTLLLGLDGPSSTRANLSRTRACVVNVPQQEIAPAIERLGKTSSQNHVGDGFAETGLTAVPSTTVSAPRVRECYLQFECTLVAEHPSPNSDIAWAELAVTQTHAVADIVRDGGAYIDAGAWRPLIYSFAELFGLESLGSP